MVKSSFHKRLREHKRKNNPNCPVTAWSWSYLKPHKVLKTRFINCPDFYYAALARKLQKKSYINRAMRIGKYGVKV